MVKLYKNNSRDSSKLKGFILLQFFRNLIGMKPAVGYYSYTNRYLYNLFILIIFVAFGINCTAQDKSNDYPKILFKLEGNWKLENSNNFEIWNFRDSLFLGKAIKAENTDTILLEKLRILKVENDFFYEVIVSDQNEGQPVKFKLIKQSTNQFVFENKKHDFPQKIVYDFPDESSIIVTILGNDKTVIFKYFRIK